MDYIKPNGIKAPKELLEKAIKEVREERICERFENCNKDNREWHQFYCNGDCKNCEYNKLKKDN